MGAKRHKPEEVVAKLRQIEILAARGKSISDAARAIRIIAEIARIGGVIDDPLPAQRLWLASRAWWEQGVAWSGEGDVVDDTASGKGAAALS